MRFAILPSIACLIAIAVAQTGSKANPPTVQSDFSVTAGKPSTFTWKPTTNGPVTLTLRSGAASDLNKGTVIASGIQNSGSYTFTLPADTTRNSDYTIEISADGDSDPSSVNYSAPFVVESSNTVESITPNGSASATTSMTVASSASSASSVSSATSSVAASTSSAKSASSTASAKSATKSSSTTSESSASTSSGSAAKTGASSTSSSGGSATSSSAGTSGTHAAAAAPSTGAGTKKLWNVQSGLAAVLLGAVAVY